MDFTSFPWNNVIPIRIRDCNFAAENNSNKILKQIKMKKIILTIAAVTSLAFHSIAQDNASPEYDRVRIGVKAGVNYSNVYDSQGAAFVANPKFGLAAGGFLSVPVIPFVGLQLEVMYSQKGFQATGDVLGSTYNFTRTTDYIDVPLFITLKPVRILTIMAGPQFSYLTRQTDAFATATTSIAQEQQFENDNLRKNLMSFVAGVDINLGHLILGGRVGWDLQNNSPDGSSTTPRYKNTWYQFTMGVRL
jgi:hypothetical protein